MSERDERWTDLVANPDPRAAFAEHFSFLTDEPPLLSLLEEVAAAGEEVSTTGSQLTVAFEDGWELRCDPPAETVGPDVPASYARVAAIHGYLALDRGFGPPIAYPGVGADGDLFGSEFIAYAADSEMYEQLADAGLGAADVYTATYCSQDEIVFVPLEETDSGEPATYLIDHEECIPRGPLSTTLAYAELFLVLLAAAVLDREYVSQTDGRVDVPGIAT